MINKKYNNLKIKQKTFLNSKFFPHIILDNLVKEKLLNNISNEIDKSLSKAQPYFDYNVKKFAINKKEDLGKDTKKLIKFLHSKKFIKKLEDLTNIKGLIADPKLEGSGAHIVKKGGYLNIHTDFVSHIVNSKWRRKLNLLLYLNKNWKKSFNGNLEFWDEKRENKISILPKFNRTVIFYTGNKSYHGHPTPLKISDNRSRKSIALYYYVDEKKKLPMVETSFVLTKKDNFIKHIPMKISQFLLKIFSFLKRNSLINDRIVTSLVKKVIKE